MAGGFRSNIFDPVLLGAQIVTLQCCFYVTMGLWLVLADLVAGIELSVDQLFDYRVSINITSFETNWLSFQPVFCGV